MPTDAEGPKIDRVREALKRGDEEGADAPDLGDPPLERVADEADRRDDGDQD